MDTPITDVAQDSSPVAPVVTEQPQETVEAPVAPAKGSQTPSENLYAALAEERRLRKEAEEQLAALASTPSTDDVFSDEGKVIQGEVETLKERLERLEYERDLERLQSNYPALKDKTSEFEDYRKDFPRHKLENVAKLFLTEKGLLDVTPERKGLEPTSGGGHRDPSPSGMTADDVKLLRENNYRQYMKLVSEGKIDIK